MLNLQCKNLWLGRAQLMLVGGMFLLGGAFYLFAFRPMTAHLTMLNDNIEAHRVELTKCRSQTSSLDSVRADVERLRTKLKEYRIQPAQQEEVQFYKEIGALQQQASLKNPNTRWDVAPVRRDRLTEIPVKLSFEGDFTNVFSFLRQAEDLPWLLRVPKMKIVRLLDKDGQVKVEMTMNLYASSAN